MKPNEEFRVEHSPSGDTILVHNRRAMTILLRGPTVERLERAAQEQKVPASRLLEDLIEERFGPPRA